MATLEPFVGSLETARTTDLGPLGIVHRVIVPSTATGGRLCAIEERTAPGKGPPRHVHRDQTEIFHFLEGDYEIEVGGKLVAAPPGTSAVVPPGAVHAFRNRGATTGRLIFMLTPALDTEGFFAALAAELATGAGGPPDPARLNKLMAPWGFEIAGPPLG